MMKKRIRSIGVAVCIAVIFIACEEGAVVVGGGGGGEASNPSKSELYAWGGNALGQLGNGEQSSHEEIFSADPIMIGSRAWKQVSAGVIHTVAIDSDGGLYTWGWNEYGQLGTGKIGVNPSDGETKPTKIVIGTDTTKTWKQVSAGYVHTAAIDSGGILYAWGRNSAGQLGIGTETVNGNEMTVNKITPTKVGDNIWKQVSIGGAAINQDPKSYTVAIDMDKVLYAWGDNSSGQLGIGTEMVGDEEKLVSKNTPVKVGDKTNWAQVSAGGDHTVAIDEDGALYVWGKNNVGQLGIGTNINKNTPTKMVIDTDTTKTWAQVSAGDFHTLAIDSDNHLFAWGYNGEGRLGDGNTTSRDVPFAIESMKRWEFVDAGNNHSAAIDSVGVLHTWGLNEFGQLGNGTTNDSSSPIEVESINIWKQVSAGAHHTLSITK